MTWSKKGLLLWCRLGVANTCTDNDMATGAACEGMHCCAIPSPPELFCQPQSNHARHPLSTPLRALARLGQHLLEQLEVRLKVKVPAAKASGHNAQSTHQGPKHLVAQQRMV